MIHRAVLLALATTLCLSHYCAYAQSSLDGEWSVTFSSNDTETREATVKIVGTSGTWVTSARVGKEKRDACVGRAFPLTVSEASADRVVLDVAFQQLIPGCKDRKFTGMLKEVNVLEGKLENGRPARLVRN